MRETIKIPTFIIRSLFSPENAELGREERAVLFNIFLCLSENKYLTPEFVVFCPSLSSESIRRIVSLHIPEQDGEEIAQKGFLKTYSVLTDSDADEDTIIGEISESVFDYIKIAFSMGQIMSVDLRKFLDF